MEYYDIKTPFDRIGFGGVTKEKWLRIARISLVIVIVGWALAHFAENNLKLARRVCDFNHVCVTKI